MAALAGKMQGHAQNAKQLQHAAGDKTSMTTQTMGQVLEWTMDMVLLLIRIRNAGKGGCMQHLVFVIYSLAVLARTSKDEQGRTGTVLAKTQQDATATATAARAASSRLSLEWPLEGHMEAATRPQLDLQPPCSNPRPNLGNGSIMSVKLNFGNTFVQPENNPFSQDTSL